ncbi:MAG TPA: hypothetical protein VLK23_09080 [Thermodesulfobacteriota bacterium]|nr:hypothetical protein [Thermodesulfobacteriota bacterium]
MSSQDEWGHDPSVQMMRRVFARMEKAQKDLLERLKLSPLDERLRRVRELALNLFEQAWPQAQRKGLTQTEEEVATLYLHCLVKILNREGIKTPPEIVSSDQKIVQFLSERFQ